MDREACPFCRVDRSRIRVEGEFAMALLDGFPVTLGHTLIIPNRHVASLFDLSEKEQAGIWTLVGRVRAMLLAEIEPDGFNIGLNDGTAAGQTVNHAHVHVIPRRKGDVANPRGGVRWIIPDKARYWEDDEK